VGAISHELRLICRCDSAGHGMFAYVDSCLMTRYDRLNELL